MGNAGSDFGRLRTAIKTGSYRMACEIARQVPRLDLTDALAITLMSYAHEPERYERLARRWLEKFLDERSPTLENLAYAAELLRDLGLGFSDGQVVFDAIKPMLG